MLLSGLLEVGTEMAIADMDLPAAIRTVADLDAWAIDKNLGLTSIGT